MSSGEGSFEFEKDAQWNRSNFSLMETPEILSEESDKGVILGAEDMNIF